MKMLIGVDNMNDNNKIDLINRNEDETFEIYSGIVDELEIQKIIWKESDNNFDVAKKIYDDCKKKKLNKENNIK